MGPSLAGWFQSPVEHTPSLDSDRLNASAFTARSICGRAAMQLPSLFFASIILAVPFGAPLAPLLAHPGGLNAEGCHNNRKTGDYHCHRGTASPATSKRAAGAAPVRRGDAGCGAHLDRDNDGVGCE